jgi:hypothetical protein
LYDYVVERFHDSPNRGNQGPFQFEIVFASDFFCRDGVSGAGVLNLNHRKYLGGRRLQVTCDDEIRAHQEAELHPAVVVTRRHLLSVLLHQLSHLAGADDLTFRGLFGDLIPDLGGELNDLGMDRRIRRVHPNIHHHHCWLAGFFLTVR